MIKVLIVEDEPPIARAVKQLICRYSDAFQVVGTEINGRAALERLGRGEVDVVFTDIRMPVMDGLELLENIQRDYPEVVTVLLSGYQEFEYAQKAVCFQAFDYLLKPVSFEKMSALLGKLEILCRNRAYLKKRDQLSGLIEGNGEASAAQADCVTLLVNAGAMPLTSDDLGAPGRKFWRGVQLEELLRSIVPERDSVLPFSGKSKTERIVVIETRSPDSARAAIETLYRRLTEMTPLPITVAARVEPVPISEVAQTISDLRTLLYREIRLCASQLLWDAPGGARRPGKAIPLSSFPVNRVVEAICAGSAEQLSAAVAEMLAVSEREGQTQFDFMRLLETIIGDSRIGDNSESYLDVKTRLGEAVLGSMDFASLGERVSEILLGMRQSGGEAKKSQEAVVAEMEQYLIDNYEKPISNEMLANKFGFVPNYISKIFRRHRGVTPSEFLTKYRVEMAIRLMKAHPDMLIKEIAQAVGYANQYYFSRIFKKETGMWPTEYPGRDAGEDG